jgi:16S rRNA (cytidine1402-2'-O)-methyltransferase
LSSKPGRRRKRLAELLKTGFAFVLYESPHRILKLFEDLADLDRELSKGKPLSEREPRYVCIGREMTKVHEEFLRGSAEEIRDILRKKAEKSEIRGEFSVFVSGILSNNRVNY